MTISIGFLPNIHSKLDFNNNMTNKSLSIVSHKIYFRCCFMWTNNDGIPENNDMQIELIKGA